MKLLDRTELPKPEEKITLYGVTWEQYDTLVSMFMDKFPGLRMTYLEGTLEIMGTSSEHERLKTIIAKYNFKIVGYYFQSNLEDCKLRNQQRERVIPLVGLLSTYKKIELPNYQEGFDKLFYVKIDANNLFVVEEWQNEI